MSAAARAAVLCLGILLCTSPHAQLYPDKPIQVLVPMQAGSAGDSIVRILAHKISENLRQQLVVQNLAGAAGLIGAERVAKSVPDGYTIGAMGDSVLTFVPHFHSKLGFDPLESFESISLVATIPLVLVVHPSLPAKSVSELIALARAEPGKLDFASGGNGSPQHVVMELFEAATKISLTHVPYRGAAQAALDVVSGRIPVMFSAVSVVLPQIKDGRLRALAVSSTERASLLPAVPTLSEAGVAGFAFNTWVGLYAPKGTPRAAIERLNAETAKALADPSVSERLIELGLEPSGSTPQALAARTRSGYARMAKMIKDVGIKIE